MSINASGYPGGAAAAPSRPVRAATKPPSRPTAENARAPRASRPAISRAGTLGDITNLFAGRSGLLGGSQKGLAKPGVAARAVAPAVAATLPSLPQPGPAAARSSEDSHSRGERQHAAPEGVQAPRAALATLGHLERVAREEDDIALTARSASVSVAPAGGSSALAIARQVAAVGVAEEVVDPQEVQEYVEEIYSKLFHDEVLYVPRPNYMDAQKDINGKMRAILVDWLVEVHTKYQLRIETLFLTVSLLDRYLARIPIMRGRLQLVGVVAMFVASKFEEMRPPDVKDFVYITDNAYTKEDILMMECTLLTTLGFQIACPTVAHFLDLLVRANGCDERHRQVAQYAAELALLEFGMVRHTPSHLAAAAMLVSNEVLGRQPAWPAALARKSRHAEQALRGCAADLRALLRGAATMSLQAVRKKFSLPRHECVATMVL